jgi:hypothetical protein
LLFDIEAGFSGFSLIAALFCHLGQKTASQFWGLAEYFGCTKSLPLDLTINACRKGHSLPI